MLNWILEKWDWWIYCRAFHSMRRMCERNPGFAYLMKLHIDEWRRANPMSKSDEHAAEVFYESMREAALRDSTPQYPKVHKEYREAVVAQDRCPECGGELDTGWECNNCGYDAQSIANDTPKPQR